MDKQTQEIRTALLEITPDEVIFDPNIVKSELCPLLWSENWELKDEIQKRLLDIGQRFSKFIGVDQPEDILFTGSLCNFNYHENSDIDIHVLVDFSKYGDPERMRDFYASKKFAFNEFRKGTTIKGFAIECYAQDLPCREPHQPSGLYSLKENQWIIKPQRVDPKIDEVRIRKLLSIFINAINRLELIEDNQARLEQAIQLKDNLILVRRKSVRALGEYSSGNICYKELRKQGYIDRLFDLIRQALDRKLSLEQQSKESAKLILEVQELDEKKIREMIRKELEMELKKYFSIRPILSKTEIERVSANEVKKQLKDNLTTEDVRKMVRQMLLSYHKWMWEKKGIWLNQI